MTLSGTAPRGQDVPRFREIFETLHAEIRAGRFPVGQRLPTEQELCARFQASRHTVREALRRLQDCGMIARRQGAGSVVLATEPDGRFHNSVSSVEELVQYAATTNLEILAVETVLVDARTAALLQSEPDTPWVRVSALRRRPDDPDPIGYSDIYVPLKYREVARDIGAVRGAVYAMIESRYGVVITEVTQTLEAGSADANVASRLNVPVGTPVLIIVRQYHDQSGEVAEVAINMHPAGRFSYRMTLQRRGSAEVYQHPGRGNRP